MNLKHALVRIFLTATVSLVVGCDTFPKVEPKLINLSKNRVLPHVLTDSDKIRFTAVRDESGKLKYQGLGVIDGGYALSAKEIADVLAWVRRNKNRCEE